MFAGSTEGYEEEVSVYRGEVDHEQLINMRADRGYEGDISAFWRGVENSLASSYRASFQPASLREYILTT